jgi:hypothetical protein
MMTIWQMILAWFGYRSGQSAQEATDQAIATKEALNVSEAIRKVDATTAHTRSDVDQRMRDGTF